MYVKFSLKFYIITNYFHFPFTASFEVKVNGKLVFSKLEKGGFPVFKEVKYVNIHGYSGGFRGEKPVAKIHGTKLMPSKGSLSTLKVFEKLTDHTDTFYVCPSCFTLFIVIKSKE